MPFLRWSKNLIGSLRILVGLIFVLATAGSSASLAQEASAFVRQVRAMEIDELGLLNPAGLAYSPRSGALLGVTARRPAQPMPSNLDIVEIALVEYRLGSARIAAAIRRFEPRLSRVEVTPEIGNRPDEFKIRFRIEAELWGQPVPQQIALLTSIDVTTGDVSLQDAAGR